MALRISRRSRRNSYSLARTTVNLKTGSAAEARISKIADAMTSSRRVRPDWGRIFLFRSRKRWQRIVQLLAISRNYSMPCAGPFDNQRKAWAEHYPFHPEAPTDGNLTPPSEPAIRSSLDVFGIVFFGR